MNNSEKMFSNIGEFGGSWETREQQMMERLEKEVGMIGELKNIVESIDTNGSDQDVVEKLNNLREKFRTGYSAETLVNLDRLFLILIERKEKCKEFEEKDYTTEEYRVDDQEEQYLDKLDEEIKILLSNDDVHLLYNLEGIIRDLSEKHKRVQEYKEEEIEGSPVKLISDLKQARYFDEIDLETFKIKSIIFKEFSINLILEPEAYEEITGSHDTVGLHIGGTAINFIKFIPERDVIEDTIQHENRHSLLDGATHLLVSSPLKSFWYFDILNSDKLPPVVIKRGEERIFNLRAPQLIDQLHQELLVALDSDELKDFYLFDDLTPLGPISLNKVQRLLSKMSTAGSEAGKILEVLSKQAEMNPNEKMRDFCQNLHSRFLSLFVRTMSQYGLSYRISIEISDEAHEDVEILTHILKPTQFHHILKYLKHKYGEDQVNIAVNQLKEEVEFGQKMKKRVGDNIDTNKLLDLLFGKD